MARHVFERGNKFGKGRPRKVSSNVKEILDEFDCNPFQILALIAKGTIYDYEEVPLEKRKNLSMRVRMEAASELCQYLAPKFRSIAIESGENSGVQLTLSIGDKKIESGNNIQSDENSDTIPSE